MSRPKKIFVLFASIVFLFNLFFGLYTFAAATGFMAIMMILIGIEEQL